MINPLKEKEEKAAPYTWDAPYTEPITLKSLSFNDGDVTLHFEYNESWRICLSQYKRLGQPLPGDELVVRICKESVKT